MSGWVFLRWTVVAAMALAASGCCRSKDVDMLVFNYDLSDPLTMVSVRTTTGVLGLHPIKHNGFEAHLLNPPDAVYHLELWTVSGKAIRGDCVANVRPGHVLLVAIHRLDPLNMVCADAGRD